LRSKLFPTELGGRELLGREPLIDRLFDARHLPLLLLGAPAGYGKSTLLAQLRQRLSQSGACVAWLSCDEADSEPLRLIEYVLAALELAQPGFEGNTGALLRDGPNWPTEALLDAFLADIQRFPNE